MLRGKWLIVALCFFMPEAKCYSREIPQLDTLTLNSGLKVYLLQQGESPLMYVRLVIAGGKKNETACQVGYSEIIQRLLNGVLGEKQKAEQAQGAPLTCAIRNGQTVLSGSCSAAELNKMMELLSTTVSRLAFTKIRMDRAVSSIIDSYKAEDMRPSGLGAIYRDLIWYGTKHPLGRLYCQYQLEKVIPEQLRDFYVEHYLPKGSHLLISGNFNANAARKTVAKHFVKWRLLRKADHLAEDLDLPKPEVKARDLTFINKRGVKHCCLKWLQPAPAFSSPDHLAFTVACQVFDRYLGDRVKEEQGLMEDTLGFMPVSYTSGLLEINGLAGRNQLARAMRLLDTALCHFHRFKVKESDLEVAIKRIKENCPDVNSQESVLDFYDPLSYDFNRRIHYEADLSALKPADIQVIVKKYFNPDAYKLVVVGKEDWLTGQLDTLKFARRYQAWDFETCDEACKEIVIVKCHCDVCYRRGQCYIWRFDPGKKDAVRRARSRAKAGMK